MQPTIKEAVAVVWAKAMTGYKRALRGAQGGHHDAPRKARVRKRDGRRVVQEQVKGRACKGTEARRSHENSAQLKREGCG